MPHITLRDPESEPVELYYEDLGAGLPVVLIHGWPVGSAVWEKQVPALLGAGYRVVLYDRRGFGASSRPASGYDYDTFAADLDRLMSALDLRDAALVGFAMGTGECVRYLSRYGSARARAVAFIASLPPFLLKTLDNRGGVERAVIDAMLAVAVLASPGTLGECVRPWLTDFRADLPHVHVPALVVHGDDDQVLPIAATGLRLHESLPGSRWVVIEGGSHALLGTHAQEVNRELLAFLATHTKREVSA